MNPHDDPEDVWQAMVLNMSLMLPPAYTLLMGNLPRSQGNELADMFFNGLLTGDERSTAQKLKDAMRRMLGIREDQVAEMAALVETGLDTTQARRAMSILGWVA